MTTALLPVADEWEASLLERYPLPASEAEDAANGFVPKRDQAAFRDYKEASDRVREFYRMNHEKQTLDFVLSKKAQYGKLDRMEMTIWEAMEYLNTLVDDSDPDTSLSQIQHLLQTAEAIRKDGHPRWMILTGLIHDLGKILCFWGEEQWAVVGDTFPVGCAPSNKIVYPEFFSASPDNGRFDRLGIYEENCGLDKVHMSWGHDEYLYYVVRDYLPEEAHYIIRYHSFYAWHRESEYDHLLNDKDRQMLEWVRKFNPYDLYSKADDPPNVEELKPYYLELIGEFFPGKLRW